MLGFGRTIRNIIKKTRFASNKMKHQNMISKSVSIAICQMRLL